MAVMGRRPKLTPELQTSLCEKIAALGAGDELFFEDACRLAGVGVSTAYAWMQKGRKQKRGRFRDFLEAVELARTQSFAGPLARIRQAGARDWKALEAWLRIAHPKRAIPQVRVHIEREVDTVLDALQEAFKDEPHLYERALQAVVGRSMGEVQPLESDRSDNEESAPGTEPSAMAAPSG